MNWSVRVIAGNLAILLTIVRVHLPIFLRLCRLLTSLRILGLRQTLETIDTHVHYRFDPPLLHSRSCEGVAQDSPLTELAIDSALYH